VRLSLTLPAAAFARNAAFTLQARHYTNAVMITPWLQAEARVPIVCGYDSHQERSVHAAGQALHQCRDDYSLAAG